MHKYFLKYLSRISNMQFDKYNVPYEEI